MSLLLSTAVFGIVSGTTTALLGAGLVTVYRGTGVVNFAHGAMATFSTFVFVSLMEHGVPVTLSLAGGLGTGGALGLAVDAAVMRPLASRAALTRTVASLGVLYALQGITLAAFGGQTRPVPSLFPHGGVTVGTLVVSWSQIGIAVTALGLTAALAVFMQRSRLGTEIRAVADSRDVAALSGVRVARVGAAAWAIGGLAGALAGILLAPSLGLDSFTLTLLVVQGLAAALTGRLESLGLALAGGVALGLLTELTRTYTQRWFGGAPLGFVNLAASGDLVAVLWVAGLLLLWSRRRSSRGAVLGVAS